MTEIPKSLENVVLRADDVSATFLRYCLSDQVPFRLGTVLQGDGNPVDYATKLLDVKGLEIKQRFIPNHCGDYGLPDILISAWVFDQIVLNGCLLRIGNTHPEDVNLVADLMSKTGLYLLKTGNLTAPLTKYSGLSDYGSLQEVFILKNQAAFYYRDTRLLKQMVQLVSNIYDPDWILNIHDWQSLCLEDDTYICALRHFFHIAPVSYMLNDDTVKYICDMPRENILELMNEFVRLRTEETTSRGHIQQFLDILVERHNQSIGANPFFVYMMQAPFKHYCNYHTGKFST